MRRTIALPSVAMALALVLTWSAPLRAGEPPDGPDFPPAVRLERALVCYRVADLACAADELAAARARQGELDAAGQVELERASAEVALARGDAAATERALDALLALAPAWQAPEGTSPELRAALTAARRRADRAAPTLTLAAAPKTARAGRALPIEASVGDPSGVSRVVLHVAAADGTVVDLGMVATAGDGYRGTIPGELVRVPEVRLWVEAWDTLGNGPGRFGDASAPHRIAVTPADDDPVTAKWWFWTAIGAGAVATGVILAVALSGGGGDAQRTETGALHPVLRFP